MGRNKLLFSAVFFLLSLSVASDAAAANFYVSNSGSPPCSNIPANGSEANPWCTINYGVGRIAGGDTLYVKAGTYTEQVFINRPAGTAAAPTVIRAYLGHIVTIRGTGFSGSGRVKITNTSYITFDGFTITNFNQGLFVENASNIVVKNSTVYDVGQEAIRVLANSSFILLENNTVHDTRRFQFNGEGFYIGTSGTQDNTNNVTVRNNVIYNTTDEAIELKPGTHDCLIEGNLIYNVTLDPVFTPTLAGAIELNEAEFLNSNPNHIVRNNVIHSSKTAIRAGTGSTVYSNLIYKTVSPYYGIYINNLSNDAYLRRIYHNTVDIPNSRAIVVGAGSTDIKNNIGPATTSNLATSDAYYVDKPSANYRLVSGSAPNNAGVDLTSIVSTDIVGARRSIPPDLGAYESVIGGTPTAPTGLVVQ